jgi:uncharacterized protein (TIGR02996 family)
MDSDSGFLDAILAAPDDPAVRLVYADWLDEHGEPERAEFLRTEASLSVLPENNPRRAGLLKRLRALQLTVGDEWAASIDRSRIEGCYIHDFIETTQRHDDPLRVAFAFQCPQEWEKLAPTDDPLVRYCEACKEPVFHCGSVKLAQQHANRGHCVAVDSRLVRKKGDVQPNPDLSRYEVVAGMLEPPPPGYHIGDRVTVRRGPFGGYHAQVRRISLSRLQATVEFVARGRTQTIDVGWDNLVPSPGSDRG